MVRHSKHHNQADANSRFRRFDNSLKFSESATTRQHRDIERQHLTNFRKAENLRKKRKARAKTRASFTANPGLPTCC